MPPLGAGHNKQAFPTPLPGVGCCHLRVTAGDGKAHFGQVQRISDRDGCETGQKSGGKAPHRRQVSTTEATATATATHRHTHTHTHTHSGADLS